MSSEALILDLSANLAPVRRRRVSREAALVLAVGGAELAGLLALGSMRPDMGRMVGSPLIVWKLGSLLVLAAISCALAIRSFSPLVQPRRGSMLATCLAIAAMAAGLFVTPDAGPGVELGHTLIERIAPVHGLLCACAIIVLSMPVMAMLGVLMRRAAPSHPEGSALASGLAAGTFGAFIFSFCCPVNDPLYIVVWYSLACGVVTAASRWLLPRRFRL